MPTIESDFYAVTDAEGMVLAVLPGWKLSLAQSVAKQLQDFLTEKTYLHHLMTSGNTPPLGSSISMRGPVAEAG